MMQPVVIAAGGTGGHVGKTFCKRLWVRLNCCARAFKVSGLCTR